MPCHPQHVACRAWLRLLATSASSITPTNRITRPHRCTARFSSKANDRQQPTATQPSPTTASTPSQRQSATPARPPARPSTLLPTQPPPQPPTAHTLTPAILSQFHHSTPQQARTLITTLLTTRATTLTPADYTTLIRLAHSLTPGPHTLVLTLYGSYLRSWPPAAAPAELFRFVLPVLYAHDRHEEVLRLWEWAALRGGVDQVLLGVVLRSCVLQEDGKLAWELFSKYRAPQRTAGEGEDRREQDEEGPETPVSSSPEARPDRRREGAELARFVEESLFPHASYQGASRRALSSPTSAFNLLHYTSIVSALRYHPHHASQTLAVLWHMHTHGVRPDPLFYNRLLGTLTTKALPHCALYVLRDMEAHGMPIDGRVYYFVITAHAMRGRWSEVVRLIAEMAERGLDVNEHIYEAAVVCCAEAGLVERAKRIVAEMQHRGVPMTWRCYSALATMAGQATDWQWVLQLFDIARDRPDFRKQLLANDAVIEAVVRSEERGEPTSLQMTAEQVYRRYFPQVIGPRGLWLLMRKAVEAERARGLLECGSDVQELLTTATTPITANYIGRMQIAGHWAAEQEQGSGSASSTTTRRSREYRLHVPSGVVNKATASVDVLLLCMLYQAAPSLIGESTGAAGEDGETWRKHLARLPACADTLLVITPKELYPKRERSMQRQLCDDPIYAARGTDTAATAAGDREPHEDGAHAEAATEQQRKEEDGEGEEGDAEEALLSSATAAAESDPAMEAVEQAEAELKDAKEAEAPSIGVFVVNTVNSLLSLVSSRASHSSSSALTPEPSEPSSSTEHRGLRLLSAVQQHLRSVYGIEARRTDDRSFHRITITPQQLTRWVERETKFRRGRSAGSGHTAPQRSEADSQHSTSAERRAEQRTGWKGGMNRAERNDGVNGRAVPEQLGWLQQVVT